jgi:hypothetical protein
MLPGCCSPESGGLKRRRWIMSWKTTHLGSLIPFLALPLFLGCGEDSSPTYPPMAEEPGPQLVITPAEIELAVGEEFRLNLHWKDKRGSHDALGPGILWVSDDPEIVRIDVDGVLHALAEGTTEIWALALGPDQDLKDGAESVAAVVRVKPS